MYLLQYKSSNEGLISADRKTSLLSCLQYLIQIKSSTVDLSPQIFIIISQVSQTYPFWTCLDLLSLWYSDIYLWQYIPYRYSCTNLERWISSLSSMDSDLEAFSHNPTHGSFAALPSQATALTNYVNQRFLSYWVGLLSRQLFHQ